MEFIGFKEINSKLQFLFDNSKMPHAIIIQGKEGVGKASYANYFALKNLDSQIKNHPDLLIIKKDKGKRDISIDLIRKVTSFLNQTSAISKNRFIIIDAADDLNKSSSNALLKTLEEPSKNCFLILISHISTNIMPTIKSRCQIFKVTDFNLETFSQTLKKIRPSALPKLKDDEIKILAKISDYSPSKANKIGDMAITIYQKLLTSAFTKRLDPELTKIITDKNFDFSICDIVLDFFFVRLSKFYFLQNEELFFNEATVFKKISDNKDFDDIFTKRSRALNLISKVKSLNLDKKIVMIEIVDLIC